jgi:hypothetical protein
MWDFGWDHKNEDNVWEIKKLKLDFCCIFSTWDMVLFVGTELSL